MKKIRKKVLVAPLDWGLGHATRSIPIIRELQRRECEVVIASSGDALVLLKKEFPNVQSFKLPSYQASYSRYFPLILKVFFQLPKFFVVIAREHDEIEKIIKEQQIHFLISDNRYGCWTKLVPTVFITHQINILMPFALKWIQGIVNYFNHRQIRKFGQCWIPDFPENRVTGKLTEPGKVSVKFIGMLSRFCQMKTNGSIFYDYLALVSGPEPQRTIFEQKVRLCFSEVKGKKMLVRGLPETAEKIVKLSDLDEVSHLNAEELEGVIEQSKLVISRSGYSSIMDMSMMGKYALFVPTPGQTEQEYLGGELMKMKLALSVKQDSFSANDLIRAEGYTGFPHGFSMDLLKKEIDISLSQLSN